MTTKSTGGCLCGGVTFRVNGKLRDVIYCHCKICRVSHGNWIGYSAAQIDELEFTADKTLKWYRSTDFAKRGFCDTCGSSMLFWDKNFPDRMGITAGCLDDPTGLTAVKHIYVGNAGDYYDLHDDLEKIDEE